MGNFVNGDSARLGLANRSDINEAIAVLLERLLNIKTYTVFLEDMVVCYMIGTVSKSCNS